MKLNEIKKLSRKEFAERYPFVQMRDIHGDLSYYDEDILFSKEVDSVEETEEGFPRINVTLRRRDIHKGDPILEFYLDDFFGWTDILLCWAEKVKPIYDSMPEETKKHFYVTEAKEKYGDLRLYLSGYPHGLYPKILEYTNMVEHLSGFTCNQCGKITKSSNGKKLMTWQHPGGWVTFSCKKCAKIDFYRRVKHSGLSEEFQRKCIHNCLSPVNVAWHQSGYKKIEGDWFARLTWYKKDKKINVAYDCHELLEGMF